MCQQEKHVALAVTNVSDEQPNSLHDHAPSCSYYNLLLVKDLVHNPTQPHEKKKSKLMKLQLLLMLIMVHMSSEKSGSLAPALYVFGDSLIESGNNNLLPTLARADFSPYGMNFNTGPTGRFTNGRTIVDFIAEFLGLPYSVPYLSLVGILEAKQLRGLNFASAACGILPQTGSHLGKCLNFAGQIDLFERIVKEELPRHYNNSKELSNYLSKSVFLISIGANDYLNNYLKSQNYNSSKRYSPQSFTTLLIYNLSRQFQRLYELGGRKVIMLEIGPIGCIPSITRSVFRHTGKCVEEINDLALIFNKQLAPMLDKLTSSLHGSSFILGRVYRLGYDAVINPSKYGFTDPSNPCCVTWFNGTSACMPEPWASTCRHPEKHYFWDGFHPTEPLYKTIATLCFNGSFLCIPKNIKELTFQV